MNYEELTDEQLVKIIRSKNQEIFSEIVKRYQNKIYYYVNRLINNLSESEDITQDVFIKVFRNLNGFDINRKFSSWVYRIAHNEAVNYLKKKSHIKVLSLDQNEFFLNTLSTGEDIVEKIIKKENKEKIKKLIEKLSFSYREIIYLRYFEEKSYEEISDILRKPINTVGTLINRAKSQLNKIIKENREFENLII